MNCMIDVLRRCGRSINTDARQKFYNSFVVLHLDYCLPVWGHLPKTSIDRMEHCTLCMLRCISNNPSACFLKTTFNQLDLRTFQRVTAVRCCVRILTAHQQDSLKNILQLDDSASSSSQTRTRSRQLRIKLSYVLELAEINIFREMKKTCFPRC